jgi:hypothetical protein
MGEARRGQHRDHDEDLAAPARAALLDLVEQRVPADGLVGGDQEPVDAVAAGGHLGLVRLDAAAAAPDQPCADQELHGQEDRPRAGTHGEPEHDDR